MSSLARITINVDEASGTIDDQLRLIAGDPQKGIQALSAWLAGIAGGAKNGNVRVTTNCVRASLVGTFTGDPTATDTTVINGVTFTARASGAVANEFNITTGANGEALAAAINASTSAKIKNQIYAVGSGNTITLYAVVPGTGGNLFTVTDSLGNFTWAGSATALSGGTEGTEVILERGLGVL